MTREQLIALLQKERREKKLGLVWERDAIEPDQSLNNDFVALSLAPEHSTGFAPFKNLLIEGDNYDVLRHLRIAYSGRVKVIYIDPPYNTGGRDFVYNDRFVDAEHRYRHSMWLEFMARRLELARDLLAEDGVILVSINEHEHARLVLLMDEIFPGMRIGSFVWRTRSGANDEKQWFFSVDHEYVLAYANPGFSFGGSKKELNDYSNPDNDPRGSWASDNLTANKGFYARPRTFYPLHNPDTDIYYPCDPNRVWAFATKDRLKAGQKLRGQTIEEMITDGRVLWKAEPEPAYYATESDLLDAIRNGSAPTNLRIYLEQSRIQSDVESGNAPRELLDCIPPLAFWVGKRIGYLKPRLKRFASDLKTTEKPLSSWFLPSASASKKVEQEALQELDVDAVSVLTAGYTSEGTKVLRQVLGSNPFPYPKPLSVVKALVAQSTRSSEGHIVLDFFAGSGTTGQAVLELNQEDDGDRRFILVSTTEATADTPDKNICRDVAAQRLKRVIEGYSVPSKTGPRPVEGTGGEFGYLRTERVPMERLHTDLAAAQTWLTLQQMHDVGLSPYDDTIGVQAIANEQQRVAYVPRVTQDTLAQVRTLLESDARTTIVYSPTPGLLEARLFSEHATYAAVPQSILDRFGP